MDLSRQGAECITYLLFAPRCTSYTTKPKKYDLTDYTNDRYSIGCLSISLDGKYIFVTISDKIICFDNNLAIQNTYKAPNTKPNIDQPIEIMEALQQLEIAGNPTLEEIKTAFNNKIREVHPDLHPKDSQAHDKTIKVIDAYKLLNTEFNQDTNENQQANFDLGNGFFINFSFHNLGDDIRAIHILKNKSGMLVGCYSGKVYLLQGNSNFLDYFACQSSIQLICESGNYITNGASKVITG